MDTDPDALGDAGDREREEIEARLRSGRPIDWALLVDKLTVDVKAPVHEHGTHVAGIIGADWRVADPNGASEYDVRGVCPDIGLYDLRVFNDAGEGDEFAILAALQLSAG